MHSPPNLTRSQSTPDMTTVVKVERTRTPSQRISRAKKGKRVHNCAHPDCGKIFTRAEHLRRHQLNHSKDFIYRCEVCPKQFVRQDLLTRHNERHALQTRKAFATIQQNSGNPEFGVYGQLVVGNPSPISDYGGSAQAYEHASIGDSRIQNGIGPSLPQIITPHTSQTPSPAHSAATVDCSGTMSAYPATAYATSSPAAPSGSSSWNYTPITSPEPLLYAEPQRPHLPCPLQHSEPHRHPEQFVSPSTGPAYIPRHFFSSHAPSFQFVSSSSLGPVPYTYEYLFDSRTPARLFTRQQQEQSSISRYVDSECNYYRAAGRVYEQPRDPEKPVGGPNDRFTPLGSNMVHAIWGLLEGEPIMHTEAGGEHALAEYLRLYWTHCHPMYPILHRPTFAPSTTAPTDNRWLVAVMLALGASYTSTADGSRFAMALYDRVERYIHNFEKLLQKGEDHDLHYQQVLLLADIFQKLRSPRIGGSEFDKMLSNKVRRDIPEDGEVLGDPRYYARAGMVPDVLRQYWNTWVIHEMKKRLLMIFFLWDTQKATMFGRDTLENLLSIKSPLPCDEYIWSANTPEEWVAALADHPERPRLLEVIKSYLSNERPRVVLSPLPSVLVMNGLAVIGLDLLKGSSTGLVPWNHEESARSQRIQQALDHWYDQFQSSAGRILPGAWYFRATTMYHMSNIAFNSNLHGILDYAGAQRYSHGRPERAKPHSVHSARELEKWTTTAEADLSTWHAFRVIMPYLRQPEAFMEDLYILRCVYLSATVLSVYGRLTPMYRHSGNQHMYILEPHDPQESLELYRQAMNAPDWVALKNAPLETQRCRTFTRGLLFELIRYFQGTRWELIQQSVAFMRGLYDELPMRRV